MPRLNNGDMFPSLAIDTVQEGNIPVLRHLAGAFGVVLLYRGSWCPFCNMQLAAFSRAKAQLDELGIKVVALSVDDRPTTEALIEKHRINFPVGYGADAEKIAAATGAYVNDNPRYLQSTGFVLDPNGKVLTAVYSSGAIGRLVVDDVIGLVRYVKSLAAKAAE